METSMRRARHHCMYTHEFVITNIHDMEEAAGAPAEATTTTTKKQQNA